MITDHFEKVLQVLRGLGLSHPSNPFASHSGRRAQAGEELQGGIGEHVVGGFVPGQRGAFLFQFLKEHLIEAQFVEIRVLAIRRVRRWRGRRGLPLRKTHSTR